MSFLSITHSWSKFLDCQHSQDQTITLHANDRLYNAAVKAGRAYAIFQITLLQLYPVILGLRL